MRQQFLTCKWGRVWWRGVHQKWFEYWTGVDSWHWTLVGGFSELGNFYFKQEQIDSAILCIEESKNLSKILGEHDLIIGANVNIGLLYKKKGNYDLALQYMNGALTAYKKKYQ